MKPVTFSHLDAFNHDYEQSAERQLATLALSKSELNNVAFVSSHANAMRQKFSVEVPTLEVTNQKSSGRCWLFAATNVLRERIAAARNLENFELSQSYLAFWDKFERCNYFLESILETAALPTGDRTVMHILSTGVHDGGQWDMFANIVRKYGVVPKDVYDETYQSSNTRQMNAVLNRALKAAAQKLRDMVVSDADDGAIQAEKNKVLDSIYGFLCSCYGEPPKGVLNLIDIALLRAKARQVGIKDIRQKSGDVLFTLSNLNFEAVGALCSDPDYKQRVTFLASAKEPTLRFKLANGVDSLKQSKLFVEHYTSFFQS